MIGLGLAAAGLAIAIVLIAVSNGSLPGERPIRDRQAVSRMFAGLDQDGPGLGPGDARVTVNVFNDLQCAGCAAYDRRSTPSLVRMVRRGGTRLEFHHFPMGARTRGLASFGAVAAGVQAREWNFVELFFRNQGLARSRQGVTPELLTRFAAAIPGLDVERWMRDRRAAATEARLKSDERLSVDLRLPAEPAAIVEGPGGTRKLVGSPSTSEIEAAARAVAR